MRRLSWLLLVGMACSFGYAAETVKLPEPKKSGGASVLEGIDSRGSASGTNFPMGKLDDTDLATILWAASGNNRDGKLWTVPMANGREPYCKIYVLLKDGAYLYNWRVHELVKVSDEDLTQTVPMQPFAQIAPANLIVVADGEELAKFKGPTAAMAAEFGHVLAGAMSQNIYLAAEAMGVGARLVYSINRDVAAQSLNLGAGDAPLFAIILGKR